MGKHEKRPRLRSSSINPPRPTSMLKIFALVFDVAGICCIGFSAHAGNDIAFCLGAGFLAVGAGVGLIKDTFSVKTYGVAVAAVGLAITITVYVGISGMMIGLLTESIVNWFANSTAAGAAIGIGAGTLASAVAVGLISVVGVVGVVAVDAAIAAVGFVGVVAVGAVIAAAAVGIVGTVVASTDAAVTAASVASFASAVIAAAAAGIVAVFCAVTDASAGSFRPSKNVFAVTAGSIGAVVGAFTSAMAQAAEAYGKLVDAVYAPSLVGAVSSMLIIAVAVIVVRYKNKLDCWLYGFGAGILLGILVISAIYNIGAHYSVPGQRTVPIISAVFALAGFLVENMQNMLPRSEIKGLKTIEGLGSSLEFSGIFLAVLNLAF